MLYDVPAPAKLNLFLNIIGIRKDGYHLIQTEFCLIDLYDILHFNIRKDGLVSRADNTTDILPHNDLTVKAALALQKATGTPCGVEIFLKKHIPVGGGLGGGSSDAASVLLALNRLWNTRLSQKDLMRIALKLGSDVPVFIFGQRAVAEGIGEKLTAVQSKGHAYLVIQPDENVSTKEVFCQHSLTKCNQFDSVGVEEKISSKKLFRNSEVRNRSSSKKKEISGKNFGKRLDERRNDLEETVIRCYPKVKKVYDWLSGKGLRVKITGSGACLFTSYTDFNQAAAERNRILSAKVPQKMQLRMVRACNELAEHPLSQWVPR